MLDLFFLALNKDGWGDGFDYGLEYGFSYRYCDGNGDDYCYNYGDRAGDGWGYGYFGGEGFDYGDPLNDYDQKRWLYTRFVDQ